MPALPAAQAAPERVVRAGDAQVERDLAGRIVGHGPRIVVVRPVLRVVVVALELVRSRSRSRRCRARSRRRRSPPATCRRSPNPARHRPWPRGAVDADAAGPGAAADVLAALVAQLVEVADARHRGAEVADLVGLTPLRPAKRLWRNSGRLLPLGAVSPTPVITIRCSSGRSTAIDMSLQHGNPSAYPRHGQLTSTFAGKLSARGPQGTTDTPTVGRIAGKVQLIRAAGQGAKMAPPIVPQGVVRGK